MAKTFGKFSDLIDFSRASGGTALRRVGYGSELVTNGTFDSDATGWALSNWVWSNSSLSITNLTGSVTQAVTPLVVGKTYTVLLEISQLTQGNWYLWVNGTYVIGASTETGTVKYNWTQSSADKNVKVVCGISSTLTVDNISVKEVLFDQPNAPLTLFNHPTNVPRIEYDADGNRLGLLIEEARTNLVSYSESFDNSYWQKGRVSLTGGFASPDGQNNAYKIESTDTLNPNIYGLLSSYTLNADYTVSIWLKAGNMSGAKISLYVNGGGSLTHTNLTVLSGSATFTADGGDIIVGGLTDEWCRVAITANANLSGSLAFYIKPIDSAGITSEVGDYVYIFGAQVE